MQSAGLQRAYRGGSGNIMGGGGNFGGGGSNFGFSRNFGGRRGLSEVVEVVAAEIVAPMMVVLVLVIEGATVVVDQDMEIKMMDMVVEDMMVTMKEETLAVVTVVVAGTMMILEITVDNSNQILDSRKGVVLVEAAQVVSMVVVIDLREEVVDKKHPNTIFVALNRFLTIQQHQGPCECIGKVSWLLLGVAASQQDSLGAAADGQLLPSHNVRQSGGYTSHHGRSHEEFGDHHSELLHLPSITGMWRGSFTGDKITLLPRSQISPSTRIRASDFLGDPVFKSRQKVTAAALHVLIFLS
ncbi:hypothetical protein P7K49_013826 [Saguinus oedipus]|uniref:Uncharacterized protein n=1 Tax=Saguinus oedipus TaxID=9490 RepID=A0ABQ9VH79_SAGOE|nr:hypothetical protein P7K49_013826 [Saguinus oedipus]